MADKKEEQASGDVKERDNRYVVEVELKDFVREEIRASFHDGYLVVQAEQQASAGKSVQKAFYIGKEVAGENIRAAFHSNVLKFMIPKDEKREGQGPVNIEIM